MRLFEDLDSGIIAGGKRNGKGVVVVAMAHAAYEQGYEVISNMTLGFEHTKISRTDPKVFLAQINNIVHRRDEKHDYHNTFLLIDEFPAIIDSQNWKKIASDGDHKVWSQLGKVGITTYCTAQSFNMVYNRYRDNANKLVITKVLNKDRTKFKVTISKQSDKDYTVYQKLVTFVMDGKKYFGLFDTHEVMYI